MSLTIGRCLDYDKHVWRPIYINCKPKKVVELVWCTQCGCIAKKLNGKFIPNKHTNELLMIPDCLVEA